MGCRYNIGLFIDDGIFTFFPLLCVVFPGNCCTVGMLWMRLLVFYSLISAASQCLYLLI